MAFNGAEDLNKLVTWKNARYQDKQTRQYIAQDIKIVLHKTGYEGSIWLPQKKKYYHKFTVLDQFGMVKSAMITDEELRVLNTSISDLGIQVEELSMQGIAQNRK